jgi:hypothetical protein
MYLSNIVSGIGKKRSAPHLHQIDTACREHGIIVKIEDNIANNLMVDMSVE